MVEETLLPNTNSGFIEQDPLPSDFILGAETGIVPEVRVASGDWTEFLPSDEGQKKKFDTMACVTFSALNSIETQMNWLRANDRIAPDVLKALTDLGFYDANGKFNASDRFTAKKSGTTENGNYLVAVWDSIRNHGILPEVDWKFDADFNWDAYYAEIPKHLEEKALLFKKYFDVKYEWVVTKNVKATPADFGEWMKLAPLHLATAVCRPWGTTEIIKSCGLRTSHATMMFDVNSDSFDIFDHYSPFRKRFALNYVIPYAIRGVVYPKVFVPQSESPAPKPEFRHRFVDPIKYRQRSAEVVALQDALKIDGAFPNNVTSTGYYGDITRLAVLAFQKKYRVASPQEIASLNGTLVGPKTTAKLNELFNH